MFNGIIEELGKISSVRDIGGGKELEITCSIAKELAVDNSLAVNGVCQTVVQASNDKVSVQMVEETLRKTTLGSLKKGDDVNLERSLTLSQRIDGHIVQGHVDTTGIVESVQKEGTNWLYTISYDEQWKDLIVGRGSIAVDGISLTVAREADNQFIIAIIPFTWDHTVLKHRNPGDRVNLEFDILGKYVLRFMENRETGLVRGSAGLTEEKLRNSGFLE